MTDLAELLEAEGKRLARKPKTTEQRDRERAARQWWKTLGRVWSDAYLLSDSELEWLARVTDATRDKPARVSHNPWTGNRSVTRPPTSRDDAVKLENLHSSLREREAEEEFQLRQQRRRRLAERLTRLGLQADHYPDDGWAAIDRYREKLLGDAK